MHKKLAFGLLAAIAILVQTPEIAQAQALLPDQIAQQARQQVSAASGVPELRVIADKAYTSKNYTLYREALIRLHSMRPNNSEYMYQLVLAHSLMNDRTAAFNIMLQMQRQGLSYDFSRTPDSTNLQGVQLFDYLNDLMVAAGQPMGSATGEVTLGADMVLPEAIEWDPNREAFLIGTVRDGAIVSVSKAGESKELFRANNENGVWSIFGLQVDLERGRLWASSASNQQFANYDPIDKGRSAILEFDLKTLELIKHYPVPVDGQPHKLGKITLAPNGDIYVVDSMLPLVYVKKSEEKKLKPFFGSREMVSLRGIDVSDDGKFLYVVDYEMGIAAIEIAEGKPYKLAVPDTLNLGGINGLNYWNGQLIIIQSGIQPQRIMSLELDENGRAVSNVAPIAVALEIMDFPNYGTVVGEDLFFFANSHWSSSENAQKPVLIASTSLVDVEAIIDPEAERLMERYLKAQEAGRVRAMPSPRASAAEAEDGNEKKE
jgi:hypothetical protein